MKDYVFSVSWFLKHQKTLLYFLNTPPFSFFLRRSLAIHKNRSRVMNKIILAILPNAIFWKDNEAIVGEFRTHDKFSKRLFYSFSFLWKVFHEWDNVVANRFFYKLNLGFDTLTSYPQPHPGTISTDGYVGRGDTMNEPFSSLRNGSGTTAGHTEASTSAPLLKASSTTNNFDYLYRTIYIFDTSSIPSYAKIFSASVSLFSYASYSSPLGATKIHIAGATTSSNTSLTPSDYQNVLRTSFGSLSSSSWVANAYNNIALNSSGLTYINKSGVTKFSAQNEWDILGTFNGTWVANQISSFPHYLADEPGTSKDPMLTVVYGVSASPIIFFI